MKTLDSWDHLADLVAKGWVLRITKQNPPGSPYAATLSSPKPAKLNARTPFIYGYGADTPIDALRALAGEW